MHQSCALPRTDLGAGGECTATSLVVLLKPPVMCRNQNFDFSYAVKSLVSYERESNVMLVRLVNFKKGIAF